MGIATDTSYQNKQAYRQFLDSFRSGIGAETEQAARQLFSPQATLEASHPINAALMGYMRDVI